MNLEFECRLCQSASAEEYYLIESTTKVYECSCCGFIQIPTTSNECLDSEAATQSRIQDEFRKTGTEDMKGNISSNLPPMLKNLAHVIEEDGKRITNFFGEFLVDTKLNNSKSIEFIDIGSGYGNNSFYLKKQFPHFNITLLEISSERIKIGIDSFKPNLKEFTFCHSLLDSEFANKNTEAFDIAFCFHVLEHVYDVVSFIKNLHTIMKPGGFAIIEVPNQHDDLQDLSDRYKELIHFPAHVNYFSKNTLLKLLDESGTSKKFISSLIPVQRYGFYNYVDWIRFNDKVKIPSDDYAERKKYSWIEEIWLNEKKEKFTTDSLMMILYKP